MSIRPTGMWALAISSVLVVHLAAQQPKPQTPPTFRSDVDLIQVDVVVLDKNGQPVRGLTKDDFTILDRKAPRPVATFQEISHAFTASADPELPADTPRDVADNTAPRSERLVVLVIDDMTPRSQYDQIKALARQVVNELGRDASMALLTTSNARAVEVTEDRSLLFKEIDRISERSARAPVVPERVPAQGGSCPYHLFEQAARMLAPEDTRRKAFVYISPYCGDDAEEYVKTIEAHPGSSAGLDVPAIRMIESLRRANVALYTIDPRGMVGYSLSHFEEPDLVGMPGSGGMERWRRAIVNRSWDPVIMSQGSARAVTSATGGFAITNTSDFQGGLARLIDDFDHYYLLGFSPVDRKGKGFRPIEVKVNRPDVTLRYRRGYQLGAAPVLPRNKDPLVQLSAGVLPRSDLPLRLFIAPRAPVGKTSSALITLEVGSLPGDAGTDDLDVRVLAADLAKSKVVRQFSFSRHVDLPPGPDPAAPRNYRFVTALDLAPGAYQLRVSARSARLDKAGSVYGIVEIPNPSKTSLALGGLTVGAASPDRHDTAATISDVKNLPFEPILDRAFTPADKLRLLCEIWRKDPARILTTKIEIVDQQHQPVRAVEGTHAAGRPGDPPARLDVTLALAGLTRGAYTVRAIVSDGQTTAERAIGIVVR